MKLRKLLSLFVFILPCMALHAGEVTLTPGYLGGKWSSGGREGCESGAVEYVQFHRNGTMEVGRGTTPAAVGFWIAKDDEITVHLLIVPNVADTANAFYRGRYTYSYLTANVLDTRQDAFDTISGTTGDLVKRTWTRCN